ncbi:MAG: FlgD immunoglobulin-like domain containing protein [Candidatus Eisenbacteria bacterium]
MRPITVFLAFLCLILPCITEAVSTKPRILTERAVLGERRGDAPPRTAQDANLRAADTTWYGGFQVIAGEYYAVPGATKSSVMWTFDRGTGPIGDPARLDNGEGWAARDLTTNEENYFRVIDSSLNVGGGLPAPIIEGTKSLWIGGDLPQSETLCWACGAGYGPEMCQRIQSESIPYNGNGSVTLTFRYFQDSEPCFDGTQVYLRRQTNEEVLLNATVQGDCENNVMWTDGFSDSIGRWDAPATFTRQISATEIGGAQNIRFVFEFRSDGAYDDNDCLYTTEYGPFGVDEISISGGGIQKLYNFETGLQGWAPASCSPVGHYTSVVDIGCYTILDPCSCGLTNNVIEMHAGLCDAGEHPAGQHVWIESPIVDTGNTDLKTIFMEFDLYAELPRENGVMIRPGWKYYPYTCPITGAVGWSPRIGQDAFNWFGADPVCGTARYGASEVEGTPVPSSAQKVIAIFELLSDCVEFQITNCTGITNFTPLLDNIAVGVTTPAVHAPEVRFPNGMMFTDGGSWPSTLFDVRAPAPANVVFDKFQDNQDRPDKCGDSLVVSGPAPSSDPNTRWEARMWWRVARRGAFQADKVGGVPTRYKTWKDRVSDGRLIDRPDRPQFTFGWMDSVQLGNIAVKDRFLSCFRENDDDFAGENQPENEMIWDDVLVPGSRIQYFITSNFANTPNILFYYPDTSGGYFYEFEILPGIQESYDPSCGFCAYQPATLYIDVINYGAQFFIENALRTLLNDEDPCLEQDGCRIPQDRHWDRYDYLDAASNWNAPFARGIVNGSNNGMTLNQLLGYRAILVNTGAYDSGSMEESDFQLFQQWLNVPDCAANVNRQVFALNGDKPGEILEGLPVQGLPFLNNTLGAQLDCDAFNGMTTDPDCTPENESYCVRLLPVQGGSYPTDVDVDAWGNWCQALLGFNVYSPRNGAAGNRSYYAEDGMKEGYYEQITKSSASGNYRTILDGVSWHHMALRDPSGQGEDRCPRTTASVVQGSLAEIGAALKWGFDVSSYQGIPDLTSAEDLGTCEGTWDDAENSGVDNGAEVLVNRLYPNRPNPFNPRTAISFRLAARGPVKIEIEDVTGRRVRTLVDARMDPGPHEVVWDGRDDADRPVASGVYWVRMATEGFESNRKMVVLK